MESVVGVGAAEVIGGRGGVLVVPVRVAVVGRVEVTGGGGLGVRETVFGLNNCANDLDFITYCH